MKCFSQDNSIDIQGAKCWSLGIFPISLCTCDLHPKYTYVVARYDLGFKDFGNIIDI